MKTYQIDIFTRSGPKTVIYQDSQPPEEFEKDIQKLYGNFHTVKAEEVADPVGSNTNIRECISETLDKNVLFSATLELERLERVDKTAGERIQFLENKADKAEKELKEYTEAVIAAKVLLIAIKKGELTVFPQDEKTPDYLQILEDKTKHLHP